MRKITFLVGFLISFNVLSAQDAHFSQFFASPLTLNPALTGSYEGTLRISTNYREQWPSALANPLKTFSVSGDLRFLMDSRRNDVPNFAAAGILFYSDRVSTFDLNTTQIAIFGAYHKVLDKKKKQYLSAGASIGITQKSINYEDLTFEDQFNAIDGYTLGTGELLPPNNFGYGDIGLGLNYSISPSSTRRFYGGVGVYHVAQPNISFYNNDDVINENLIRTANLNRKISAYAGASFQTSEFVKIQPRALFLQQGDHQEVDLGVNFRYELKSQTASFIHFGPWIRGVKNVDGFGVESVVAAIGFEVKSFIFGLSYDHNFSDLINERRGLNAFELSITFIGEHDNESNICPEF